MKKKAVTKKRRGPCIGCGGKSVPNKAKYHARGFYLFMTGDVCLACERAALSAAGDAALRVFKTA